MKLSVYTKSIQETNNVTVENHQPAVLFKFAKYKMLFCKYRCDCPIHEIWWRTMVQWRHNRHPFWCHNGLVMLSRQPHFTTMGDVAAAQCDTSVQLYYKYIFSASSKEEFYFSLISSQISNIFTPTFIFKAIYITRATLSNWF